MPTPLTPVPSTLGEAAFTLAEGRGSGLTDRMMQHRRFEVPFRGVRRHLSTPASDAEFYEERVERNARRYIPLLRYGEAFSHTTALVLCGAPIRGSEKLHVAVPRPAAQVRRSMVCGHRVTTSFPIWHAKGDIPIVPPAEALVQAAALLGLRELVVAIDHLILPRQRDGQEAALAGLDDLEMLAAECSVRGIRRLRAALEIAREGAESRMETLLRYELARMGLDYLELQVDVHDAQGRWIGRFDMVDRKRKLIIEYDGEQHRTDRAQYVKDEDRLERAREAGYRILRLRREHFFAENLPSTRRRICDFLGRDPRPLPAHLARYF